MNDTYIIGGWYTLPGKSRAHYVDRAGGGYEGVSHCGQFAGTFSVPWKVASPNAPRCSRCDPHEVWHTRRTHLMTRIEREISLYFYERCINGNCRRALNDVVIKLGPVSDRMYNEVILPELIRITAPYQIAVYTPYKYRRSAAYVHLVGTLHS